MALYTVILDYRGGTYISQVKANSPQAAVIRWARDLNCRDIKHLGEKRKQSLVLALEKDVYNIHDVVELKGLKNAWCVGTPLTGALVNIVKTDVR